MSGAILGVIAVFSGAALGTLYAILTAVQGVKGELDAMRREQREDRRR